MAYQFMKFEVRDNVAWIVFNRPEAFNAINFQATREFYDIVNRCSVDRSIRAVVLTGAGERAFCAGGDVAEFVQKGDIFLCGDAKFGGDFRLCGGAADFLLEGGDYVGDFFGFDSERSA